MATGWCAGLPWRAVAVVTVLWGVVLVVRTCDETMCASLVSKCLLLKACECDMLDKANCTCCKGCHRCLSKLYSQCCDCVGMCPSRRAEYDKLEFTSSIEELREPIPALFSALTEEPDPELRWTIHTYPAHLDLLYFLDPRKEDLPETLDPNGASLEGHHLRHGNHHLGMTTEALNCTVAFHSQCMSLNKCKDSCQSMGAARYRWFHQFGCCECVGHTCLNYGKAEALCLRCPLVEDEDTDEGGYYYNEYYTEGGEDEAEDVYEEDVYREERHYEEEEEEYEEQEESRVDAVMREEKLGKYQDVKKGNIGP